MRRLGLRRYLKSCMHNTAFKSVEGKTSRSPELLPHLFPNYLGCHTKHWTEAISRRRMGFTSRRVAEGSASKTPKSFGNHTEDLFDGGHSLQELYTFWISEKKSQKVLRCDSHQNGFPKVTPHPALPRPLKS